MDGLQVMSADEEEWDSYLNVFRERRSSPHMPLCQAEDVRDMEDDERGAVLLVLQRLIVQAQRRNPLHAEVMQRVQESAMTQDEALAAYLHGQVPSPLEGNQQSGPSQTMPFRRWCAQRVAAGELHVLEKARAALTDLAAAVEHSGAETDDDEASDAEDEAL